MFNILFFFPSGLMSIVSTFVFVGLVVSCKCVMVTYEYSIDDVTPTWSMVNLPSPQNFVRCETHCILVVLAVHV